MVARRVVIVAFDDVQVLDVTGPLEVFSMATRLGAPGGYATEVVARAGRLLTASNGLAFRAAPLPAATVTIDTLVVAGGRGTPAAVEDAALVAWLRQAAGRTRRVVSVCTGAFVLAEAGLLDGRRATTHWSECDTLAARYPSITVEPDRIFVRDGQIATSAGVTAGIDLALALVEEDHGAALALAVARELVVFVKRPGGQTQFSSQLSAQLAGVPPLRELQEWIGLHLDADLSVPALARRAGMSGRNFARFFRREVGMTPGDYVESMRVAEARHWLETTDRPVAEIARRCGFGTIETMYRTFQRRLNVPPGAYRSRFRAEALA